MDTWRAKWIWRQGGPVDGYNQSIVARRTFEAPAVIEARIRITADSYYRLFVNGRWVADGPCRSWPEHYQYDEIDVARHLTVGANELRVVARYWGAGTFHTVPRQAGLLAQLDMTLADGGRLSVGTDSEWRAAEARAWVWNTPKISIQMEPQELYDARVADELSFEPAAVLFEAEAGPWRDLHPRDVALLTLEPFAFRAFREANVVRRRTDLHFCLPSCRLANPGVIEAQRNVAQPGGAAAVLELDAGVDLQFHEEGVRVWVDGRHASDGRYSLAAGRHVVLVFVTEWVGHRKEQVFRIVDPPAGLRFVNPVDPGHANPWCWIAMREHTYVGDDMRWPGHGGSDELEAMSRAYAERIEALGAAVTDERTFAEHLGDRAKPMAAEELFVEDSHWLFTGREVVGDAASLVEAPEALTADSDDETVVSPSPEGDVELVYDLGEQNVGYYELDLTAEAGVAVDVYAVEHITPDGRIQHTGGNRNGMRYITRAGANRFTSTKRRSGRYVFVTLRNQTAPVRIRRLRLIESTYPVRPIGRFACSDSRLDQVWEIAARTLKLCMEDTFTDCPLYEQTLWVGDARNESAFAYPVFDAVDIGRRCIRLAGQSLERYPIVGCQLPSSWDVLLPAWSFLWGISVWDYYAYTGDEGFVREVWPWVIRNLEGAEGMLDSTGLFSGLFWNMFDWTGIDDRHAVVLHNSMLMKGAVDAALRCAKALGDAGPVDWLRSLGRRLRDALNRLWDTAKSSYPDSIHADGSASESTSQHTSVLGLLYNIVEQHNSAHAMANILDPPEGMVRVGSPFAIMYFYEALEKVGEADAVIRSIYDAYLPMLEAGATTVWETFPQGNVRPGGFPTRSHCHAWSSAPVYFLGRIILGVRPTAPGGAAYEISPRLNGLAWAEGVVATARGPLRTSWKVEGDVLRVRWRAPEGVDVLFVPNDTHEGLEVDSGAE